MREFHLNETLTKLSGPSQDLIKVNNQWAAVALNIFHSDSKAKIMFAIDGNSEEMLLNWDSGFSTAGMRERIDMANHGGVGMAMFVMSVLLGYSYAEQSERGDGVDYRFTKTEPKDDDLNFLNNYHYVEVSGILEESLSNTLKARIKNKHGQIDKGGKRLESSSVIVTLFSEPKTVKEIHK